MVSFNIIYDYISNSILIAPPKLQNKSCNLGGAKINNSRAKLCIYKKK